MHLYIHKLELNKDFVKKTLSPCNYSQNTFKNLKIYVIYNMVFNA